MNLQTDVVTGDVETDGARGEGLWWRIMQEVCDVSVIGCVGPLIVATRGFEGAGEVLLNVRGSKEAYLAWSEEPLPRGTEVLVIDTRGPRTVVVEAWSGFGF
jgi:membrane-bound ClpP family serine protease